MSRSLSGPRVAVVGGGVLGVSTAAQLAQRGADVVLVSEGELGSGASGRSLSWLNSFGGMRSEAYHRLRMAGIDRYRTLAARVPRTTEYLRFDGGLTWAEAGKEDLHRAHLAHMRRHGYDARWVGRDEVADWTPGVDPAAVPAAGAIFNPGEGWVDLIRLIAHLADELKEAGGRILTGTGPASPVTTGGSVTAVITPSGERLEADHVLLAAGAEVPRMLADFGVKVPDATPTALLVRTEPVAVALRATLNTPHVSLRPAPGGRLVMDSDAAASQVTAHADGSYDVPPAAPAALLAEASRILAEHPVLQAAWVGVGPKPIPGDGEPVLGAVSQVPGLHVAFTHSGATLALIAGELLAEEILTGDPSPLLAEFSPERFQ